MLPPTIADASPLDPLLLLPLPKNLPPSLPPDLDPLLAALNDPTSPVNSVTLLTAQMRQITRRGHVLLNAARVGASEARAELDKVDVDLRGVEYELNRVREEIEKCEGYDPMYKEMNLAETTDYTQTITRLQEELDEIDKQETILAQLTHDRDNVVRAKKEIKKRYDAADVYLIDFCKTTNLIATKIKDVAK